MKFRRKFDCNDRRTLFRTYLSNDHREYGVMANGSVIRLSPQRPWRGKSERRQVVKNRRDNQ